MNSLQDNAKYLIADLIYGDKKVGTREDFIELNYEDINKALQLLLSDPKLTPSQKKYFIENAWRIQYEHKPPTPEEFLSPKWIGQVADKIYPHTREVFLAFLDPTSPYRVLALSTCIGFGKSFISTLIVLYIILHLSYMKSPKKHYGINVAGSMVVALLSFTQVKAKQLLLQPFYQMISASPIFEACKLEDQLPKKQSSIEPGHIAYTTAGRMGAFQFAKDIHIATVSERADLLGLNIIAGIASEISFWIKKGVSIEDIWGSFNDLRSRINNRFGGRYLTATILDSSPYDLNLSPIDKWIYKGEATKEKDVLVINAKHWDVFPVMTKYPIWIKTKETFPVFRGDGARPPKIITSEAERSAFSPEEIYDIPIDLKPLMESDMEKTIKDYCAWPTGADTKLIQDFNKIEKSFSFQLQNIYTHIVVSSDQPPEKLIWNMIRDQFFICYDNKRFEFYRAPYAKRYLHLDLSESNDMACIGMCHLELNKHGKYILVFDFTILIHPGKGRINLDAITEFLLDLRREGNINIRKVTSDQYQSATMHQRLQRENINAGKLSVDRDPSIYKVVLSWLLNERLKVGKNIYVKNNWKSLVEVVSEKGHRKIDHVKSSKSTTSNDGADWKKSVMGFGAKDATDTIAGAGYAAIEEMNSYVPEYMWTDDEEIEQTKGVSEALRAKLKEKMKYVF